MFRACLAANTVLQELREYIHGNARDSVAATTCKRRTLHGRWGHILRRRCKRCELVQREYTVRAESFALLQSPLRARQVAPCAARVSVSAPSYEVSVWAYSRKSFLNKREYTVRAISKLIRSVASNAYPVARCSTSNPAPAQSARNIFIYKVIKDECI